MTFISAPHFGQLSGSDQTWAVVWHRHSNAEPCSCLLRRTRVGLVGCMTGFFCRVERLLLPLLLRWGDTPWSPDFPLNRGFIHNGAMVPEHLHRAVQPAAPALRPSVQWSLQIAGGRWERDRLLENRLRVCAFESCPSRAAEPGATAPRLPLEQFWRISESALTATGLVARGPRFRRDGDSEGQRSGAASIRGEDGGATC